MNTEEITLYVMQEKTLKDDEAYMNGPLSIYCSVWENLIHIQKKLLGAWHIFLWWVFRNFATINIFHKALILKESFSLQSLQHPSTRPLIDRFLNVSDVFMIQMRPNALPHAVILHILTDFSQNMYSVFV